MTDKRIENILKKYKLNHVKTINKPDGGLVRSWVIVVRNNKNKQFILKALDSTDDYAKKRFVDEIKGLSILRHSLTRLAEKKLIPKIYYSNSNNDNLFFICDYFRGDPIGIFNKDFGIGLGFFNKDNFKMFLNNVIRLNTIKRTELESVTRKYDRDRAEKESKIYINELSRDISKSGMIKRIEYFLSTAHKGVFVESNSVFCQLDPYPANILINKPNGNVFKLIDWEYLGLAPIGFSPAFLFLMFWKESFWNSKIYSYFYRYYVHDRGYSEQIFNSSFRYFVVVLGLRLWYQTNGITANRKITPVKNAALNTFLHYINEAISGRIVIPSNIKFYVNKWDIQNIANIYELGTVVKYDIYYSGRGNTVAKVITEDNNAYVFRYYHKSRSALMVRRELSIYDNLNRSGLPTYKVFRPRNGSLYVETNIYGRKRRVAVLSYLNGSRIHRRWDSVSSAKSLGLMLRNIHEQGIVHNDMSKENVLFTKGKITGVIDFEWGRFTDDIKARERDLAKTIVLWLIDIRCKNMSGDVFVESLVSGYYNGLPDKKVLGRLVSQSFRQIEKERELHSNVFLKHEPELKKKHLLKRFVTASDELSKFAAKFGIKHSQAA